MEGWMDAALSFRAVDAARHSHFDVDAPARARACVCVASRIPYRITCNHYGYLLCTIFMTTWSVLVAEPDFRESAPILNKIRNKLLGLRVFSKPTFIFILHTLFEYHTNDMFLKTVHQIPTSTNNISSVCG